MCFPSQRRSGMETHLCWIS
ncbi:hypothetical protein M8C21_024049 [Ambrosia artemisiifolia]|uniref:Uncharacterized protein n=1 Tax=Ambrosia artemisiifolia TaxID=4212 RepID=A0AAD5G998_AMBAR|nr:hypothetical protein M8C21_024049 [Ambrosia artemisiifolia]